MDGIFLRKKWRDVSEKDYSRYHNWRASNLGNSGLWCGETN